MASCYSCPYQYAVLMLPIFCAGSQSESLGDSWNREAQISKVKFTQGVRCFKVLWEKVKVFLNVFVRKSESLSDSGAHQQSKVHAGGRSIKHGSRSALRGCTGEHWCVYCPVSKVMGERVEAITEETLFWNRMKCATQPNFEKKSVWSMTPSSLQCRLWHKNNYFLE